MIREKLKDYFNVVFEDDLINEIIEVGTYKKVKENELLLDLGDKFDKIPLMLNGAIKISREDEHGDEIVLYFLERGDTCTITFGSGLIIKFAPLSDPVIIGLEEIIRTL